MVLDRTTDGVVVTDAGGVIQYVNEPLLRLFGFERAELLGKPVEVLVPNALRDDHHRHVEQFVDSPDQRPMGRDDLDIEGRHADGTSFPIDVQLSTLPEVALVVATVRDMTAARQASVDGAILRIDLAHARDQIEGLHEALDQVIQSLFALGTSMNAATTNKALLVERVSGASQRIDEIIDAVQQHRRAARI